jgi:hypothetical protein
MMTDQKKLRWNGGEVTMQPRGAMLRDLALTLEDGRITNPLHTAPWVGTSEAETLDGLMQALSGEWPCVPFGGPYQNLSTDWNKPPGWEDEFLHGYAAHHDWDVSSIDGGLEAEILMPEGHPIRSMSRRVMPTIDGIAIDLWVEPRRDCRLPIGLHPVFALPQEPERMTLHIDGATGVISHPETPPFDTTPVRPNVLSDSLSSVQGTEGELLDFAHLPRPEQSESRLLVLGSTGRVSLTDSETGDVFSLSYDADVFPFVMLWVSNRGRADAPWSGRHLALGVKPVRAAFDLGTATSAQENPLAAKGYETAYDFKADQSFHTRYTITAQST